MRATPTARDFSSKSARSSPAGLRAAELPQRDRSREIHGARRTEIAGRETARTSRGPTHVRGNYAHDLDTTGPSYVWGNSPHTDGIQVGGDGQSRHRQPLVDAVATGSGANVGIIMGTATATLQTRHGDREQLPGRPCRSYAIYAPRTRWSRSDINGYRGHRRCLRLDRVWRLRATVTRSRRTTTAISVRAPSSARTTVRALRARLTASPGRNSRPRSRATLRTGAWPRSPLSGEQVQVAHALRGIPSASIGLRDEPSRSQTYRGIAPVGFRRHD